jgi:hypothetical protein
MNADRRPHSQSLFRVLLPQIILLGLILVLYSLSMLRIIPSPQELNRLLVRLFLKYGLPLIALSSLLENIVGLNAWFPGAFTILTGMSLTAGHPSRAILTYLVIYIPAYCANVFSYILGRSQRQSVQTTHPPKERDVWLWFVLTYWHPQLASVTAFSMGIRDIVPRSMFLVHSLLVSALWSVFWAVTIYHFGLIANVADYFGILFLMYLLIWAATDTWKFFSRRSCI